MMMMSGRRWLASKKVTSAAAPKMREELAALGEQIGCDIDPDAIRGRELNRAWRRVGDAAKGSSDDPGAPGWCNRCAMGIEDIPGLPEPLKKLIQVVSYGVGAVARPWLLRKDDKMLSDANKVLEAGGLPVGTVDLESLTAQVAARVTYQEAKRQRNLGQIVEEAQKALPESVSTEPVDSDWINRFFTSAQDISNEQMQHVWGRLLAGEVTMPGSFSLRALDCLRNLTSADARVFSLACEFALYDDSGTAFLISPYPAPLSGLVVHMSGPRSISEQASKFRQLYESKGLDYQHIQLLSELGLIRFSREEECRFKSEFPASFRASVRVGPRTLVVEKEDPEATLTMPSMSLTSVGRELFRLHTPAANLEFEALLVQAIENAGFQVRWEPSPSKGAAGM